MSGRDVLCSLALQSYRSQTANVLAVGSAALVSIHILTFYPPEHTPGFGFLWGNPFTVKETMSKTDSKAAVDMTQAVSLKWREPQRYIPFKILLL